MAANDIYEVALHYYSYGEKMVNTFKVCQIGSDGGGVAELQLADAVYGNIHSDLEACMSEDCVFNAVVVRRVHPTVGGQFDRQEPRVGTVASDSLPTQNCVCINFFAATAGPRHRGRMHFPGVPDSFNEDGLLTAAAVALYNSLAAWFRTDFTNGGWTFRPGLYDVFGVAFYPFASSRLMPWIRTLRGRRRVNP